MKTEFTNLLVLCCSQGSPTYNCYKFLSELKEQGATVQLIQRTSDVALTRNNQAALAYKLLDEKPDIDWVLWLDWDMSAATDSILYMMAAAIAMSGDSYIPSISGSYINRHLIDGRSEMAAFAVKGSEPISVNLDVEREGGNLPSSLNCMPALTGMGCLLQHRTSFVAHCLESEWFVYPKPPNKIPCVCQAHLSHASEVALYLELEPNDDNVYWIAEDFDYCMRELDGGRLVYVVPIAFGHDKVQRMLPNSQTMFPGLRQSLVAVD